MTTHHQHLLAAMRGQQVDGVPWAPRMDLWQIALQARGALPTRFAGMHTADIARQLDVACHAVRGDYTLTRPSEDVVLRGLGIDNHPDYPYRVEIEGLSIEADVAPEHAHTVVHTSAGDVTTHLELTAQMKAEGISLPFVRQYPIETVADLERVAEVFEHCRVIPTPAAYAQFHQRIGEAGVAVASGPIAASPMHLVLHDLMAMDRFFYLYADEPEALRSFATRLDPFYDACLDAVVASAAEVVFWGANYDRDLTWPPFLEQEIAPWLRRVAERLHDAGKLLLTHCDGENDGIGHVFADCGVDVVESVCPTPMTSLDHQALRTAFGPDVTIWGGVPSVALLEASMSQQDFSTYVDDLCEQIGDGHRWILGVSDNVPPDADMARLEYLRERFAAS